MKKSYRIYFTVLFLLFGAAVAVFTSVVNYNLEITNIREEMRTHARDEILRKRIELGVFTTNLNNYIMALRNDALLIDFIRNPDEKRLENAVNSFYSITRTSRSLMQVRYLDEKGVEKIRIDWPETKQEPFVIPASELQNKHHRYYFAESSQLPFNSIWFSKLDLNVENKQIEVPHKPVLRVASPVFVGQVFRGIVIINVHAKEFLNNFKESHFFDLCLVDQEGHFILHFKEGLSWSRYLQSGNSLKTTFPGQVNQILQRPVDNRVLEIEEGMLYAGHMAPYLNKDNAQVVLIPKRNVMVSMKQEMLKAAGLILGIIFFLSIPLSLILAQLPARLSREINNKNITLQEYVNLIDENIITSLTSSNGVILEASEALSKISGYSKKELIGQNHKVIRHPDTSDETYQTILATIKSGRPWYGEMKYKAKDGTFFWTDTLVYPKYNGDGLITGYTSIRHDITDKKRVEELSVTDELTGLHNRRYFNRVFQQELHRNQRSMSFLSFIIMDVDHFKSYNDNYGHQMGDAVLASIGKSLIEKMLRGSDFCFRLGGEEFGILFSGQDPNKSRLIGEQVLQGIEGLAMEHKWNNAAPVVTVSMGLVTVIPTHKTTAEFLYKNADSLLYKAKEEGRNRLISG